MKKQIIAGIATIACVGIEAGSEGTPEIFIFADIPAPRSEAVAESEPPKTDLTAEEETQKPVPTQAVQSAKPSESSSEPRMGDVRIVGGEESAPCETAPPPSEQPETTGDVIYIELQPIPTKDSTWPPYKPGEAPPSP